MGSGYSAETSDSRTSPEDAMNKLMYKVGVGNYQFCWGNSLEIRETTDGFYETNVCVRDAFGVVKRAEVNRLWDSARNHHFYRAWFGLAL
jgi:hypothetical protein